MLLSSPVVEGTELEELMSIGWGKQVDLLLLPAERELLLRSGMRVTPATVVWRREEFEASDRVVGLPNAPSVLAQALVAASYYVTLPPQNDFFWSRRGFLDAPGYVCFSRDRDFGALCRYLHAVL